MDNVKSTEPEQGINEERVTHVLGFPILNGTLSQDEAQEVEEAAANKLADAYAYVFQCGEERRAREAEREG